MCLACDLHCPSLGYDVHGLVSHVTVPSASSPGQLYNSRGQTGLQKVLSCCSFGSGFDDDARDSLGCPSLLPLCLESLFQLTESEPGPLCSLELKPVTLMA